MKSKLPAREVEHDNTAVHSNGASSERSLVSADGENGDNAPVAALAKRPNRSYVLGLGAVVVVLALVFGGHYLAYARTHPSTDDAQVDVDTYQVTPQATGRVSGVFVENDDYVKKGQVLATIDPRELKTQLDQAKATLAVAEAAAGAAGAQVGVVALTTGSASAQAGAAVDVARAQAAAASQKALVGNTQIVAEQAALDVANATVHQAQQEAGAGEGDIAAAQAELAAAQAGVIDARNNVRAADAGVTSAREELNVAEQGIEVAHQGVSGGQAQVNSSQSNVAVASANIAAAQARALQAQTNLNRARELFKGGAIPRSILDADEQDFAAAQAQVTAAQQTQSAAGSGVSAMQASVASAQAGVTQAVARRNQAQAAYAQAVIAAQNARQAVEVAQTKVSQARADLLKARGGEAALQAAVAQDDARVAQAVAVVSQARGDYAALQADLAQQRSKIDQAVATLHGTASGAGQQAVSRAQAQSAAATVAQARAKVEQLEVQLSYCSITAPHNGIVSQKNVAVGMDVPVGQPLLTITDLRSAYVEASFKETQMDGIHVGSPAIFTVDAYPGRVFRGHVASISSGTGAVFSLLPPENASGNFTKVVQRIPVKIVADDGVDADHPLRYGMSIIATVSTGGSGDGERGNRDTGR